MFSRCVLALDEVWDPQNFGALIRTSHFLKVDKIVVCAKNSAPPSPVVSKASAGALEVTPIYSVQNMMRFIDESVLNGWQVCRLLRCVILVLVDLVLFHIHQVVGASLSGKTVSLADLPRDKPTIVLLGNEGHGIRTNILHRCTHLVRVGSGESTSDVDSLNVSVTGGIILHHMLQNK
jgi:21S rRNA (GM2251-2'-O)-methyltransferase